MSISDCNCVWSSIIYEKSEVTVWFFSRKILIPLLENETLESILCQVPCRGILRRLSIRVNSLNRDGKRGIEFQAAAQ